MCSQDKTIDTVVSLTTKQNVVVVMVPLGPTSSELTFSAFDMSASIGL